MAKMDKSDQAVHYVGDAKLVGLRELIRHYKGSLKSLKKQLAELESKRESIQRALDEKQREHKERMEELGIEEE